jgi:hypothetical protein
MQPNMKLFALSLLFSGALATMGGMTHTVIFTRIPKFL